MGMDGVLHSFTYSLDYLREQVADVPPADMVAQPRGLVNHPAWTIGHLTFTCEMLGGAIGLAPWLAESWTQRYGSGSVPAADIDRYEPKDRALAMLMDARDRIAAAVAGCSEAQLNAPFPDPAYRDVFPSIRHALVQVLIGHTAFHVGQVSQWRKAMGLGPMGRSFE